MKWFKFREIWAEGPSEWEFIFSCEELMTELSFEKEREWDWTDKFRGIEWKEIIRPPISFLRKRVQALDEKITSLELEKSELQKMLDDQAEKFKHEFHFESFRKEGEGVNEQGAGARFTHKESGKIFECTTYSKLFLNRERAFSLAFQTLFDVEKVEE